MLEIKETKLKGVFEIMPKVFGDARGWFLESWSDRELKAAGIDAVFVHMRQNFIGLGQVKKLFVVQMTMRINEHNYPSRPRGGSPSGSSRSFLLLIS